ncbi:MAG: acetyltransferase [Acidobacteriota bacterium]|nr:acetyltransferase [Acidobacteriota bacterium]
MPTSVSRAAVYSCVILAGLTLTPVRLPAQSLMRVGVSTGTIQLIGSDSAVLQSDKRQKDLPCTVTPVKPSLGFDLRFHAGYEIALPLREIAGDGDLLTIIFRVTPDSAKDSPYYFSQKYLVPEIQADAKGDANLAGEFDIGEGDYHVDWLMRDQMERVCSWNWDVTAALSPRDQGMKLAIPAHSIDTSELQFFKEEARVTRMNPADAFKIKVLMNFAPQQGNAATMQPVDMSALVSILRNISREPRICRFSIVVFNMNEQRVVYRQDDADHIDFPELGKALASVKFGMVDYKKLTDPHSGSDFLSKLVLDELGNNKDELGNNKADAVVFAGPKVGMSDNVSPENLRELTGVSYPVFYMNYNLSPQQNPWHDPIGKIVKHLRGYEYTITRPRDLWTSWSDIMSRIVKLKLVTTAATSSQ